MLYALHQCHKVGVCHGDIKLENITVTSWNWVMLVDFASFKPTFLPIDNPGSKFECWLIRIIFKGSCRGLLLFF